MSKRDLTVIGRSIMKDIDECINENKYEIDVDTASDETLIDLWLQWNGVIGYTKQIIDLVNKVRDSRREAEFQGHPKFNPIKDCDVCDGTGLDPFSGVGEGATDPCPKCNGTGEIHA